MISGNGSLPRSRSKHVCHRGSLRKRRLLPGSVAHLYGHWKSSKDFNGKFLHSNPIAWEVQPILGHGSLSRSGSEHLRLRARHARVEVAARLPVQMEHCQHRYSYKNTTIHNKIVIPDHMPLPYWLWLSKRSLLRSAHAHVPRRHNSNGPLWRYGSVDLRHWIHLQQRRLLPLAPYCSSCPYHNCAIAHLPRWQCYARLQLSLRLVQYLHPGGRLLSTTNVSHWPASKQLLLNRLPLQVSTMQELLISVVLL